MMGESHEAPGVRRFLWGLIAHNFWLKVLSVAFSIVLFFSVQTEETREYTKAARLKIITDEKIMVLGPQERAVYVTVKLSSSLFARQPDDNELTGELDVRNQKPGRVRLRLSSDNFPALDSKRYNLIIHDPWIDLDLDNVMNKEVQVRVPVEGRPRDGFVVEKVIVNPEKVHVVGAKRELQKLVELSTSIVNIDGIDKSFSARSKVVIDDNSSIHVKDDWVQVQVAVGPQKAVRTFSAVPVEAQNGRVVESRPTHVEVELTGDRAVLEALRPSDVRIYVNTGNLASGWNTRPVRIRIPEGTSFVRVIPDEVLVRAVR
jgi:YbbR domain-containing protein